MKIVHIVAGSGEGGLEKHVVELTGTLAARHEIHMIAHREYADKIKPNVIFHPLDLSYSRNNPLILLQLWRVLRHIKPDMIHAHANKAVDMVAKIKIFLPDSIGYVASLHSQKHRFYGFEKFDHVIGVSHRVLGSLKNVEKSVVYNGIVRPKAEKNEDYLREFGIRKGEFVICAIGRLEEVKNFSMLLNAVASLSIKLLLVGDGSFKRMLQMEAKTLGIENKVIFTGYRSDTASLLSHSNMCVISSKREGFSYVMAEALLLNRPIVATDVGDMRLLLPKGAVVPVDDSEAMRKLIVTAQQDYALFYKTYESAFRFAQKHFTIDAMTEGIEKVYESVGKEKYIAAVPSGYITDTRRHYASDTAVRMPRILMVSLDYPPTVGGITAHVHELSKALVDKGCHVSVATRFVDDTQPAYEHSEGIDVYRFSLKYIGFTYGYQINRFLSTLVKEKAFDLIHIHGMRPLEFYAIEDMPLVYTNHTSGYLKRLKKGGYRIPMLKRLFNKPDLFLAPSEELLEIPFKTHAPKCFIPNGVTASRYLRRNDVRYRIRKKLGIADDEVLAIVTRRMVWKNGVTYLAQAMQYLHSSRLKLLLIGDGEEFSEVREILERYFTGRYHCLGSKTHEEIIDYYSAADISVLPSLMEATSISGLEAMAASLPLIGTRVGGIPTLIEEGVNGYLCNPGDPVDLADKIDTLLASDIEQMGARSRRIVEERFDWEKIAERTIEAYRMVL